MLTITRMGIFILHTPGTADTNRIAIFKPFVDNLMEERMPTCSMLNDFSSKKVIEYLKPGMTNTYRLPTRFRRRINVPALL